MFGVSDAWSVYVYRMPIDFRKSINGLSALVEHELKLDVFSPACFVFSNRRHDKVKILFWQVNGFWLCYKRLEAQRFIWPRGEEAVIHLTVQQLQWLLEGIDLRAMRGHHALPYRHAA